jgi:hypothetical protein
MHRTSETVNFMKNTWFLWIIAFIITAASALYQYMTGPSYPVRGSVVLNGRNIPFKLNRSHAGSTDFPVSIETNDESIRGAIEWKRSNSDDPWTRIEMTFQNGILSAQLPNQPQAGKLEYRATVMSGAETRSIPAEGSIVVRFRGDVPWYVLIPHIIAMFGGMLLSTRAGLEALKRPASLRMLILLTIVFLFAGGFILGPLVQHYAFGAYWTGWPLGHDLTDNKTAVALIAWLAAYIMLSRSKHPGRWALVAAIITLLVYLIPHSLLGSEIDYRKAEQKSVSLVRPIKIRNESRFV